MQFLNHKRLLVILCLFIGFLNFPVNAQISDEEIALLKKKLNSAPTDLARASFSFNLANGYRFYNVDSSFYYSDLALKYLDKLDLPKFKARILSLKGATLLESGRLPESLQLQFDALNISQQLKDTSNIAYALNRIGNTYMELADYRKANEYYFRSKDLFEIIRDSAMYYNEISNIGNIYELMGMADSALYYQQVVLEASNRNPKDRGFITWGEMMFRMGNAHKLKGEKEKALMFYKQGIKESLFDNDIRNLTMNNLLIAKFYDELGLPDSSIKYAYDAIKYGKAVSFRKGVYDASELLSGLFKKRNQPDSAFKYLDLANVERDSLIGAKRFRELQSIVLQEQERQRKDEIQRIAAKNKQRQFALLAGLGVFLVIAAILYFNNKQKQKTNKILENTLANLKSTQSQLIQSEKMASLGEMTAGIAHEIQNPLNFVNNFSEVNGELLDELKSHGSNLKAEEQEEILNNVFQNNEKIIHHGKRADAIVKNMLMHSSAGSGKKDKVDINALADETLRLAYHGLRARDKSFNATLHTEFDPKLKQIEVIPRDVGRVLLNLLNNALFAVDEKRKTAGNGYEPALTLRTEQQAGKVIIAVKDNGTGIPDKIIDKIFQPFFTTKATGIGTGLGLSLSYDIIKAHGGTIHVRSKPGEGSEFIVELPG